MTHQKSIARLFFFSSLAVISILTLVILVAFVFSKYLTLGTDLKNIENQFIDEQIQLVKSRVNELISYIDYNKSQTEEILKTDIKERTYYACSIASSIYEANKNSKSKADIQRMIRDTLRPIRFYKDRGYYFIDDLEGNIVMYPAENRREGESALNQADIKGKYIVRDFIDIIKSRGEGFSTYYYYKFPERQEGPVKKISFVKYFEPYNWLIGTGEYVEDVEDDVREKIIDRVHTMRFGKNQQNYFFLLQILDIGSEKNFVKTLVNPNRPDMVGKTLGRDFKDDGGYEFMRDAARQLLENEEAVVNYRFKKMETGASIPKSAYFRLYKEWNWIIGAGFYYDDLQPIIAQRKSELGRTVLNEIYLIIGIFIMISFLAVLFSRVIARKLKNEFNVFSVFFKDSAKKYELLDKSKLKIHEFRELADLANRMITEKKDGEEELLKSKEIAEAATRAKSEFLANVSHEIRTPMTAIIGMSDILAQTPLNEEQYEYLEIITTSANNLLVIINDILDFSKIEAGRMNIDRINFNVREIIEGVADMVASRAHKKQLELITLIEPEIPDQLLGDSSRLHQILLNLTNNAVKFTDKGEIVISAELAELKDDEKGI
ncbi:MAG: cache domain-containing protein, partial [Candidatus Aminicenantes bacterium]|nr:cache domain-containing protein [Candidatus Aminicenantes bacterium]